MHLGNTCVYASVTITFGNRDVAIIELIILSCVVRMKCTHSENESSEEKKTVGRRVSMRSGDDQKLLAVMLSWVRIVFVFASSVVASLRLRREFAVQRCFAVELQS